MCSPTGLVTDPTQQYIGYDRCLRFIQDNQRWLPNGNWLHCDSIVEGLILAPPPLNPGLVHLDFMSLPRTGADETTQVLNFLSRHYDHQIIVGITFMLEGQYQHDQVKLSSIISTLQNTKFGKEFSRLWRCVVEPFEYQGSQGKQTRMSMTTLVRKRT
jgi:hypothetical protein